MHSQCPGERMCSEVTLDAVSSMTAGWMVWYTCMCMCKFEHMCTCVYVCVGVCVPAHRASGVWYVL